MKGPVETLRKFALRYDSLAEATRLAAKQPDRYKVGAHGWVTAKLDGEAKVSLDLLRKWIDESHRLAVGEGAGKPKKPKKAPRI